MRIVKIPDNITSISELDTALKYKNGTYKHKLTTSEVAIIQGIYNKYDKLLGEVDDDFKSVLLNRKTNDAIHDGYTEIQIAGRLKKLRETLLLENARCPYCGIMPIDELDHYLPQSIFKAISVYSRNLVPICHKCNNKKRATTGSKKSFFHAYFEKFPVNPVFTAEVNFVKNVLLIEYKLVTSHVSTNLKDKLDFQFERTDLNARLIKESNEYLFDKKATIELMYNNDNGVKKVLMLDYDNYKTKYGVNFWKTALLLSLANCEPFCKGGFKYYFKGLKAKP